MAHYIAGYDLYRGRLRNCHAMRCKLESWGATRLLESLWVFDSDMSIPQIRDELLTVVEPHDAFVVFEVKPGSVWACEQTGPLGIRRLRQDEAA